MNPSSQMHSPVAAARAAANPGTVPPSALPGGAKRRRAPLLFYAYATGATLAAAVTAHLISRIALEAQVAVLFLSAVLACAILWGLGPSLFAAALSVAIKTYLFYPPIFSFHVDDPRHFLDLCVFAVVAVLGSKLATQMRRQTEMAVRREANIALLHAFSGRLASVAPVHDIYLTIIDHVGRALGREIVVLVPMGARLAIVADRLYDNLLSKDEIARAEALWRDADGPSAIDAGRWELLRLVTARGPVAVLAIDHDTRTGPALDDMKIRDALLDQAAIAIERAQLASEIEDARVRARTEELRDAAISAVSHDLQTPLASIVGSATALRRFGPLYDAGAREELVITIHEEAERLNHFIRNVLDLTRIRSDAVRARREPVELSDIVNAALQHTEAALAGRPLTVTLPPDLPMLRLDGFLMERALVNLIENAARFSPAGSPIAVLAARRGEEVHLDVTDRGAGIAEHDRARIFGAFVQVGSPDSRRAGTGLGLAIVKAFVEANGGRVEADSGGRGRGATFRIVLPAGTGAASADAPTAEAAA